MIDSLLERSLTIETEITTANEEFDCDNDGDKGTNLKDFLKNRFDDPISALDDADEESLCTSNKKTIRPKALPSISDNKFLTIVNHGEFSQTVTIETCT